MNVRRRIFSVLLVLCMVFGCCAATADTELTQSTEQTTQTSVVLDLGVEDTAYTIVIPSTIPLDNEGKATATITLKSGFVLSDVTDLYVRMTDGYTEAQRVSASSGTYKEAYILLHNTENDSKLYCDVTSSAHTYITKALDLIHVTNQTDNSADRNCTLDFEVTSAIPSYGKYVGTLTFSVITA